VLHSPSLTFYRVYASQGNVKLLRTIRQSESLFRGLDSLRAKWRQECLVHGDPRWDNILLSRRGDLTVVDWELSTLGDPCWDLGCVLVEHVNFWLGSVPITACTLPDDLVAKTRAPLVRVRASLAAFWQAYITARRWNARTARRALIKCVEFAGARLVQSAIEQTQGSTSLNALAVYQVQLAANLLLRPQAAAELLGLATVESAWPLDTNLSSLGSEARSA
jgi:aminoglycoside phosphotransferase (APT) family kinase protein